MTHPDPAIPPPPARLGVWLVGARGAISTCVAAGLSGLASGRLRPIGLLTERAPASELGLVPLADLVLGGCDVRGGSALEAADEQVAGGVLAPALVAEARPALEAFDRRIVPGLRVGGAPADGADRFSAEAARLGAAAPRAQVEALAQQITAFREELGGAPVVVVNVASTEAWRDPAPAWRDLAAFEAALDRGERPPTSALYAYAAMVSGASHVNFTPSVGAAMPALLELARERRVAHCGNDGKTGETLLKTTLAPMFTARALEVLAWQGYNMLGNRDGEVLADPEHKRAKLRSKDEALRQLLANPALHSHVAIDYVPSLGDWKTAMDYVHFEGFLGARMSLSFTWHGSDSALAAPLVIDLARLVEFSARTGHTGELTHLSAYFKSPLGGSTHDFHLQHQALLAWVRAQLGARAS